MIISLLAHTAVCPARAIGALVLLVAVQLSVVGLYLRPVFKKRAKRDPPPQMIISLPVETAVEPYRVPGALVVLIAVQLSMTGLYLPPVFPFQTIISVPAQTAVPPEGGRQWCLCFSNCRPSDCIRRRSRPTRSVQYPSTLRYLPQVRRWC
jgi:hypothetical protein